MVIVCIIFFKRKKMFPLRASDQKIRGRASDTPSPRRYNETTARDHDRLREGGVTWPTSLRSLILTPRAGRRPGLRGRCSTAGTGPGHFHRRAKLIFSTLEGLSASLAADGAPADQGQGADLIARCGHIPVYTGDREVLASLTGYALTRGIFVRSAAAPGHCGSGVRRRPAHCRAGGHRGPHQHQGPSFVPPRGWGWTGVDHPHLWRPLTRRAAGSAWAPSFRFPGPGSDRKPGTGGTRLALHKAGLHLAWP